MIRLYLLYSRALFKINSLFSILFALFLAPFFIRVYTPLPIISGVISGFIYAFMTGGFLVSVLYFELSRKHEYYFYYNLGISKIRLFAVSYMFNIIVIIPFIFIRHYVEAFGG